jgi:4-amino-4-deoxy-L-arabinose transferase-like glycosyltransferase
MRPLDTRLVLFAAGVTIYSFVWFGLMDAMPMVSDASDYLLEARAMAQRFPALLPPQPFYSPPGTAMMMAAFCGLTGVSQWSARLLTLTVSALTVVAVRALAQNLTVDRRIIEVSSLLALLYPPALLMSGQSYSQAYAQFWLVLLALALLRGWLAKRASIFAAAGFIFGFGCLTRPSMLSLWAVLAGGLIFAILRGRTAAAGWNARALLRASLAFVAAFIVVVAPVVYANHIRGAQFTLSTNNERNFFLGNNRYTPDYKTWHLAQKPLESLEPEVQAYLKAIYESPNPRQVMMQEAVDYIRANPGQTLWRTLSRLRAFWGFDYLLSGSISKFYSLQGFSSFALFAFEGGGYVLVMFALIVGVFHGWEFLASRAGFVIALVLGYQIPYAVAFAGGTYHFPVMGLLFPFAAAGSRFLASKGSLQRISRWAWVCMVLFGLVQIEYAYQLLKLGPSENSVAP